MKGGLPEAVSMTLGRAGQGEMELQDAVIAHGR